jgi:hypothetical protein
MVSASADRDVLFRTEADFVLEAEQWKLKTLRFYKPLVDAKDEVNLPWPN